MKNWLYSPVAIYVINTLIGLFIGWLLSFLKHERCKKTSNHTLMLGLAKERLITKGEKYILRNGITQQEYDALQGVAEPYLQNGGNGTGEKIWEDVDELPIISQTEAKKRDYANFLKCQKLHELD